MTMLAKVFLCFLVLVFAGIGLTALADPAAIAGKFDLALQSTKASAEVRGLYGGGFVAWALIIIAALRFKTLAPGLLTAMGISMGAIAIARIVSIATDYAPDFNLPAFAVEALAAGACWILYKNVKPTA